MQVQHETQLIEGLAPLKAQEFAPKPNQTLESYTLTQTTFSAFERLISCPVGNLIAAFITSTNQIIIIDTKTRARRERFPLKSCDKKFSRQSFTLKGIDFSPDGTRLAIGQTDCIIYIYKLSTTSSGVGGPGAIGPNNVDPNPLKPTITGKFVCSSPVLCLIWTEWGIVFGTQDGKVKLISMSIKPTSDGQSSASTTSAKVNTIYSPQSKGAIPISFAFKSPTLAIGFVDGKVILLASNAIDTSQIVGEPSLGSLNSDQSSMARRNSSQPTPTSYSIAHTCPPYYLAFLHTNVICCAGSDGKIAFHLIQFDSNNHYHNHHHHHKLDSSTNNNSSSSNNNNTTSNKPFEGSLMQTIELKEELMALDYSPINEVLAIVTSSKLFFIKYNQESRAWQLQASYVELSSALSLTSVLWTREGSQLIVGTLSGSLELFRCSWSKQTVGEQLDICHIAKNRVRITDRARNLLATYRTQYDIKRVNLLDNGQSVIIWTTNSLLLARLGHWQQSEISWGRTDRNVKFCFDYPGFVLVFKSADRQLLVIKLGQDSIIYSVKMDSISKSTISVRQYESIISGRGGSGLMPVDGNDKQRSPGSARSRLSSLSAPGPDSEHESSLQQQQQQTTEQPPMMNIPSSESLNERLAFVMDSNQLVVINLKETNQKELIKHHKEPIIWIEFSHTSNSLVFRDSFNGLYLLTLDRQHLGAEKEVGAKLMLDNCEFANWLLESDILIAQSSHNISIWYNIDELNKVTVLDSRGYNINRAPPIIDLSFATSHNKKPYLTVIKIGPDHQLVLSNGQLVPLDRIKVKFYTEIVGRRLASALEVLEKERDGAAVSAAPIRAAAGESNINSNLELWSRLGWLAVEQADVQVAIKAFEWLGHSSMVKYLEMCLAKRDELEWRLALIRGDWDTFERAADPQQIVSTYKRLNRWTLLIDYLDRSQQFRQRDLAELEFRQWLLDKGRHLEGAKIQAKNGDLLGAVELLVANKRFTEAADLFIAEEKVSLARAHDRSTKLDASLMDLAKKLCSSLMDIREFHRAALLCDKVLGKQNEALDLYLRGESYERAIELAKSIAPDKVNQIEESHGDHLVEQFRAGKRVRRQTFEAIDRFLASGKLVKALGTAIELKALARGYEIFMLLKETKMDTEDDENLRRQSLRANAKPIAEYLFRDPAGGDKSKAIEILLIGEHYNQVMHFYIEEGKFKEAFWVSLNHINDKDRDKTVDQFTRLAEQMIQSQSNTASDNAEKIYLMLDKPELAIEMHKRSKNYDRMLELISEFSPDSLEPSLLLLAREFESEGQYEEAEQYLLRASQAEWTNVVRMYRLAGKWEDAYRVTRANCSSERDPLLIQLAYWWAKSLGNPKEAYELLRGKLNILNPALEFCCENRNFQFALELCECDQTESSRLREMVRRCAASLEEQHKFDRAEEVLLRFNLVEEASKMYLDNDQHLEAIRVVESQLGKNEGNNENNNGTNNTNNNNYSNNKPSEQHDQLVELLNRILVLCADRLMDGMTIKQQLISGQVSGQDGERLLAAQQMYLRAQRPELAVNLYKERGLWKEAIQVAQRFAPQLLESLESALDAEVARDVGPIVAQMDAERRRESQKQQQQQLFNAANSMAAANSSSSQVDMSNNLSGNPVVQQRATPGSRTIAAGQQQVASNTSAAAASITGPDYLKLQAESSMRNGDLNGTKTALGKFLDSLIEGGS